MVRKSKAASTERYAVEFVQVDDLEPSPENDDLYGYVSDDDQMEFLVASIRKNGLEEPLIVSADNYIISGHRRFFALKQAGIQTVPIRRKSFTRKKRLKDWHKILADFNPQRVKSVGSMLKESLLRFSGKDDARLLLKKREDISSRGDAEFNDVDGEKTVHRVSEKKQAFLAAVKKVIQDLSEFWPLTIRQIHYNLLNDPPLITTPKRSKFNAEHYRYRNNETSYNALGDLLTAARYSGDISMRCIDDPTRPKFTWNGWASLSEFIEWEMDNFLCGYNVDRQLDQPRHIEVLGEKNTLMQIVKPVCKEFYVPFSIARGYASIPLFREIATRYKNSGKTAMTLIVASDFDPEGLDLADDAIRTLRDLWGIQVDYHRVGVNEDQIDEMDLQDDHNPAKESSSRFDAFVERTGDTKTWELEALPPQYLQDQVRAAILQNLDLEIYEKTIEREEHELEELQHFRKEIVGSISL